MAIFLRIPSMSVGQLVLVLQAIERDQSLSQFVELKGFGNNDSGTTARIDLRLDTECDLFARGSDQVPVTREMLDPLWDILEIFPRSNQTKLESFKQLLVETYELATDISHEVRVPGSLPEGSTEWKISMGLGELRTSLEGVAGRFGFKPFFRK